MSCLLLFVCVSVWVGSWSMFGFRLASGLGLGAGLDLAGFRLVWVSVSVSVSVYLVSVSVQDLLSVQGLLSEMIDFGKVPSS